MSKLFPVKDGETRCIIASKSGVMSLGAITQTGKTFKRVRYIEAQKDFHLRDDDPEQKAFVSGEYKDAEEIINWILGK